FSEDKIESYITNWHKELQEKGMDDDLMENSLTYGQEVADHILSWADKDMYKETRTYEKFTVVSNDPDRWQPTPPAYMEAIEPHWNKIRPFVIDSATQFVPEPPTPFDTSRNSNFFQEMKEVYEVGVNLSDEQAEIASFWDCNPYVMNVRGHVMFATKKITPGGHWIGIVKIACIKDSANLMKSAAAYALTSVALADGFISCWDEKYRSNLIRPETVINKYLDEEWQPLLQTPPFPEYTSGHSVISGAAGVALTSIFGEPFHFVDSTEVRYGLPAREFNSFTEASDEAAISRLYGGIHYMPAIENGITQGRALGRYIVNSIELKED
ncbi:MAG: vanadium-dependent haloperoxidase, partial [Fulvivirga sp.]|nr:vanadium-dependent haloperoxidase [Fulvivirga sp.]